MLAVTRLRAPDPGSDLAPALEGLLRCLSARTGFDRGQAARALDDPGLWVLVTEWADVGAYRRCLSAYDVKLAFADLMPFVLDEPSAYAAVSTASADG